MPSKSLYRLRALIITVVFVSVFEEYSYFGDPQILSLMKGKRLLVVSNSNFIELTINDKT